MSGAWSVKGIDPKVREAVREAAARSGMTLGEYLSAALQSQEGGRPPTLTAPPREGMQQRRTPSRLIGHNTYDDDGDDWNISSAPTGPRIADPVRLAQRIDSIERRTQLAVTGLDRAVSTIDRSVLGLSARIDDAERLSNENADRIAEALDHFREAGDVLGGRLEAAEQQALESRRALESAHDDAAVIRDQFASAHAELVSARERLEGQVATAEEVARRAEAAATFLTTELENRDAALSHKINSVEDGAREALRQHLAEARATAEAAAVQASEASADAVAELRRLAERMAEKLNETETSTRRAVDTAIEINRAEQQQLHDRVAITEAEARQVKDALTEEVIRLESEIGSRIAAADQLKAEQAVLISRIERAEAGARESTAGLRQAAGAAIADLRNAQLTLAARVKQVEETASRSGVLDLGEVRDQQTQIAERLAALEEQTRSSPMLEALSTFEKRIADIDAKVADTANASKLEQVDGAVQTLDQAMKRLADRIAETESTANSAIRTLEQTVSSLGAKVEASGAKEDTEALRQMLETRLDGMNQTVTQMVGEARSEIAGQINAALESVHDTGLEGAVADVNRRLAAAERRQAQTIEAISIEIKRMSETVDKRLRAVEDRGGGDAAAGVAVREELARMSNTLEHRFDEIERREAAAFDRMGLEVGRLSERLEERVGTVESRSAQAIEQVGEQVARMAERFNQRHETLARDLGERMIDSEERATSKVAEAISSIMQRLSEVEEHSEETIAPMKSVMSSVASRLEALQSRDEDIIPTPSRRDGDFGSGFNDEPYISPRDAAQPLRAGPLPPTKAAQPSIVAPEHDIYFAEEIEGDAAPAPPPMPEAEAPSIETKSFAISDDDDLIVDDVFAPPPEDDDPFWTPEIDTPAAPVAAAPSADSPLADVPASFEDEILLSPLSDDAMFEPEATQAPTGKNDYLNAARKAAQAQAAAKPAGKPGKAAKAPKQPKADKNDLRGSSRVVLWGAASALTLLAGGGLWYMNQSEQAAAPEPQEPQPEAIPPTHAVEPAVQAYDPNAPFGEAATDPFAAEGAAVEPGAAPIEGAAPAAPAANATAAPAAPGVPVAANAPRAGAQRAVAGPLPPRNASLEQAAQSGDLVAQYELGLQRVSAGRAEEGATLLRQAANRGLAMAQYRLGKLYERGEGVPTDLTQARQWTERAAAAGNRRAMHDLGVYFARGEGAPQDEAAAFRWFRQAAELGVADSQYNLGVLYQQGRGVNANPSEAMFWFMVASRAGDEDAGARAQALQAQLQPIQVEQARARAQAFRARAASAQANGEFGARSWAQPAAQRPAA